MGQSVNNFNQQFEYIKKLYAAAFAINGDSEISDLLFKNKESFEKVEAEYLYDIDPLSTTIEEVKGLMCVTNDECCGVIEGEADSNTFLVSTLQNNKTKQVGIKKNDIKTILGLPQINTLTPDNKCCLISENKEGHRFITITITKQIEPNKKICSQGKAKIKITRKFIFINSDENGNKLNGVTDLAEITVRKELFKFKNIYLSKNCATNNLSISAIGVNKCLYKINKKDINIEMKFDNENYSISAGIKSFLNNYQQGDLGIITNTKILLHYFRDSYKTILGLEVYDLINNFYENYKQVQTQFDQLNSLINEFKRHIEGMDSKKDFKSKDGIIFKFDNQSQRHLIKIKIDNGYREIGFKEYINQRESELNNMISISKNDLLKSLNSLYPIGQGLPDNSEAVFDNIINRYSAQVNNCRLLDETVGSISEDNHKIAKKLFTGGFHLFINRFILEGVVKTSDLEISTYQENYDYANNLIILNSDPIKQYEISNVNILLHGYAHTFGRLFSHSNGNLNYRHNLEDYDYDENGTQSNSDKKFSFTYNTFSRLFESNPNQWLENQQFQNNFTIRVDVE